MNFVCGNATNPFHAKLIIRSKATKTWAQQIQDNDSMQFCFIAWSPSTMLLKKNIRLVSLIRTAVRQQSSGTFYDN